ncbi:MAG: transglycosylase domain-containing protein [Thermodesulfobacteriota bacterium]
MMKTSGKRILGKSALVLLVYVPLFLVLSVPFLVAGASLGAYLIYGRNLPEIPDVTVYKPKTVSTFYSDDGTVIGVFYKQKRFVVELSQMPPHVVNAFIAAEDRRFHKHNGIDWEGVGRAIFRTLETGRLQGGSSIPQQLGKNFLLTSERKISRKVKEMILAPRLVKTWGKEKILYVYLNEIYLGEGCYGVEAAARNYFDKPVEHLSIAEAALIAGIVPSPSSYNPFKNQQRAELKQQKVLESMVKYGFITRDQYEQARKEQLQFRKEIPKPFDLVPDFTEAVRRYIVKEYGQDKLYNEGLKVFTTCNVDYQRQALQAVEKGLADIKERGKDLAILRLIKPKQIKEYLEARTAPELVEGNVYRGVVMGAGRGKTQTLTVALAPQVTGRVNLPEATAAYRVGHLLALRFLQFEGNVPYFELDNETPLQGALVSIENKTGFVRALVGGVSKEHFQFNRATQAKRQPGSAFKPFIYATAVEKMSYSPATVIVDEKVEIGGDDEAEPRGDDETEAEYDARRKKGWIPKNAGGKFLGPISMRYALEHSVNVCTVKILMDVGLDPVIETARKAGIKSHLGQNLSLSLGTSELSLYELTSAYTVFPNSGVYLKPTLVKRIEDRFGTVLEDNTTDVEPDESTIPKPTPRPDEPKEMTREVPSEEFDEDEAEETDRDAAGAQEREDPDVEEGDLPAPGGAQGTTAQAQPAPGETERDATPRVSAALSPQTAWIMTNLLQGGVKSGTGAVLSKYLKREDLAGKTGTTQHAADAWFVGFNPDYTTGVWVGYDEKRPIGAKEAGSTAALPIWGHFMADVLKKRPVKEFVRPRDIVFEQLFTFKPGKDGTSVPVTVSEPVYAAFKGKTLILWPDDPVEILRPQLPPPMASPGAPMDVDVRDPPYVTAPRRPGWQGPGDFPFPGEYPGRTQQSAPVPDPRVQAGPPQPGVGRQQPVYRQEAPYPPRQPVQGYPQGHPQALPPGSRYPDPQFGQMQSPRQPR